MPNGITKYRIRNITSVASRSSRPNCGSATSIAASNTPRLPGRMAGEAEQGREDEHHRQRHEVDIAAPSASTDTSPARRSRDRPRRSAPAAASAAPRAAPPSSRSGPSSRRFLASHDPDEIGGDAGEAAERDQPVDRRRQHVHRRLAAAGCQAMPMPSTNRLPSQKVRPEMKQILATSIADQAVVRIDPKPDRAAGEHRGADIVADGVAGEARQRRDPVGHVASCRWCAARRNHRRSACRTRRPRTARPARSAVVGFSVSAVQNDPGIDALAGCGPGG